mmetsp:Transcript_57813/g.163142  ORF Transcript_57813/g.163142 Transcript_57813/m.163142 type:complete len:1165 (+) Transcript_57813:75-3569(+)
MAMLSTNNWMIMSPLHRSSKLGRGKHEVGGSHQSSLRERRRGGPDKPGGLRRANSDGTGVALPDLSPSKSSRHTLTSPTSLRTSPSQQDSRPRDLASSASEPQLASTRRSRHLRSPSQAGSAGQVRHNGSRSSASLPGDHNTSREELTLPAIKGSASPQSQQAAGHQRSRLSADGPAAQGGRARGEGQGRPPGRPSAGGGGGGRRPTNPDSPPRRSGGQSAKGERHEEPDPAHEESIALAGISLVAQKISEELDEMCKTNGVFSEQRGDDMSDHVSALREISSVTYKVHNDLSRTQEAGWALPAPPPQPAVPYDDATLAKARKITQLTNMLCEDLKSTADTFGDTRHDSDEKNALQEISTITKQVCDEMSKLQEEGWAAKVLGSVPAKGGTEEGLPTKGPCSAAGEPRGVPGVVPQEPDAEPPSSQVGDGGMDASESMSLNATGGGISSSAPSKWKSVEGLRDLESLIAKHDGTNFSDTEIQRMLMAFKRFKVPDSGDLHMGDLPELLRYLGHVMTQEEGIQPMVKEITPYEYMDFEEFQGFMQKYIPYEHEQFHVAFDKYDADGSGEISVQELRKLIQDLGFMPVRLMIKEALQMVDSDNNGQLDFDELMSFLIVYGYTEGFTRQEIAELRRIFSHFSVEGDGEGRVLPAECLSDALVQFFGVHIFESAKKMEDALKSGQGMQKSAFGASPGGKSENLHFAEFIIFARKSREAAHEKLSKKYPNLRARAKVEDPEGDKTFAKADTDGSGGISMDELRKSMVDMRYTPLKQNIEEIFSEVIEEGWTAGVELDFNEFFDFMLILRQREGFLRAQVEEMRSVFSRFDDDGSGEISALELSDLFRHLGYTATLDDIHIFVRQVDENGSNQLDFREFLRLMRLHREQELAHIREEFDTHADRATGLMNQRYVVFGLTSLGHEPPKDLLAMTVAELDFDTFVGIVDSCRNSFVIKQRKKAGFSDEEIEKFKDLFNRYDKDKSGEIDTVELMAILKEFCWEPKSREEQQALVKKLDVARDLAREAGIKDVGTPGASNLKFWAFVQLARMLNNEHDRAEEDKMDKLMQELRFTHQEVDQFRQIFRSWAGHEDEEHQAGLGGDSNGLERDAVRRLVRSLGVSITPENKGKLDQKLASLDGGTQLNFMGFLKLMHWLVETDFAGVNGAAAKKV